MSPNVSHPESGALTSPDYWHEVWAARSEPHEIIRPRSFELTKRAHERAIDCWLAELMDSCGTGPLTILELGCAPGLMIHKMHSQRPNHMYFGLDYVAGALSDAEALFCKHDIKCTLYQADCRDFAPPHKFDLVVSFGLIEHFQDPLPIVRAHAKCCRPGGLVALTIPNYRPLPVRWLMSRLDPDALVAHNLELMRTEVLKDLLNNAKLVDVKSGMCGPSLIRTARDSSADKLSARVLQRIGQLGNMLPPMPFWKSTVWATGQVRQDT